MGKVLDQNGLVFLWNKIKSRYVQQMEGKGLSENDYTDVEKQKLETISPGAKVNVQSDWSISDNSSDAFIKNKPTSLPADGGNATTVNSHTVNSDVPAGAKFTDTTYTVASTSKDGLMPKADFAKLAAFGAASSYALKSDIVGMYKYKGSVANEAGLPTSGQITGDVYNIQALSQYGAAGANVAWDGTKWDSLGEIFTMDYITNAEIDEICV